LSGVLAYPPVWLRDNCPCGQCRGADNPYRDPVPTMQLLHARTAFADAGSRHLQGCYADLDGLASTLTILEARP
jgi:hypothetical protein